MGVLNVTPDSFSDGGLHSDLPDAVAHAQKMVAEGARIIDIGGESTRPGSLPVPPATQIERTVPVIQALRKENDSVWISIDTCSADVANAALRSGADIVNDVSAMRDDPAMIDVLRESAAAVILMHRRGLPADMQNGGGPQYDDVVSEVAQFLDERRRCAIDHGVEADKIVLDPGIGFGKKVEHNLLLLKHLSEIVELGSPVLVGASRKSFIGKVLEQPDPEMREPGSLASVTMAAMHGASILRVHEVAPAMDAVRLCHAIQQSQR